MTLATKSCVCVHMWTMVYAIRKCENIRSKKTDDLLSILKKDNTYKVNKTVTNLGGIKEIKIFMTLNLMWNVYEKNPLRPFNWIGTGKVGHSVGAKLLESWGLSQSRL